MSLLRLFFLFLLPLHWAMASPYQQHPPSWIKQCAIPLEPIPLKIWETHVQHLLLDVQKNWAEKTTYFHHATKAMTQEGVRSLSQIHIDYHPHYQNLVMHSICIWREGKGSERLEHTRHEVLHRELQLVQNVYYGSQTAVYFLDDIREGDIVEFSYSLLGEHPFLSSHFSDMFLLQNNGGTVRQMYRRLLMDPKLAIEMKTFNSSMQPQILQLSPQLSEWTWEVNEPAPYFSESNQPSWYSTLGWVQLSQYKTWKDVIDKFLALYVLPEDLRANPGSEMVELMQTWNKTAPDDAGRVLMALRFVQDKVRYFGFEEGIGAFQPSDPRVVLNRRYGDCKDKTFLLQAFLHLMGISSTPIIVNINRGEILPNLLPTPAAFDHIVLKVDLKGKSFFVDPTWTHQGGSLATNSFPDFQWGLPLSKEATGLIRLPTPAQEQPIEIHTHFKLLSQDIAELTVVRKFCGAKADIIRNYVEWVGGHIYLSAIFLDDFERVYGKSTFISRDLADDLQNNILTLTDAYQIATLPQGKKRILKIRPFVINSYLVRGINPDRISPLSLTYPLWVKEEIHIENPFANWSVSVDTEVQTHESFRYSSSVKKQRNDVHLQFELQHLKDHVPLSSLQSYWSLTEEIDRNSVFRFEVF